MCCVCAFFFYFCRAYLLSTELGTTDVCGGRGIFGQRLCFAPRAIIEVR